jgi:hypothetical protein
MLEIAWQLGVTSLATGGTGPGMSQYLLRACTFLLLSDDSLLAYTLRQQF